VDSIPPRRRTKLENLQNKSEGSELSLPDNKLNPYKITELRQEKDKQEYERLSKKLRELIRAGHPSLWDWITDKASAIGDAISMTYSNLTNWVSGSLASIGDSVNGVTAGIDGGLESLGGWIGNFISRACETLGGWFQTAVNSMAVSLSNTMNFFSEATSYMADKVVSLVDKGQELVKAGFDQSLDFASSIFNKVSDGIKAVVDAGIDRVKSLIDKVVEIAGDIMSHIAEALMELPGLFLKLFSIDEESFIEDNLKLMDLQERLSTRLQERVK
jgi:phage-related protein